MNKRLKTEIQLTLKMKFSGLKVLNANIKRQRKQKKSNGLLSSADEAWRSLELKDPMQRYT